MLRDLFQTSDGEQKDRFRAELQAVPFIHGLKGNDFSDLVDDVVGEISRSQTGERHGDK